MVHQMDAKKSEDTTATATPLVELSSATNDIDEINPKKTANFGQSINQELKLVDSIRQSKHFKNISQDNKDTS